VSEPPFKLMHTSGVPVSDEDLLRDLRSVAGMSGQATVKYSDYESRGKYSATSQANRFGSWNNALLRAGLTISRRVRLDVSELFENLLVLWQHFGRQPTLEEASTTPSRISGSTYQRRFGSWPKALNAFVDYANGKGAEVAESRVVIATGAIRRTPRDPSLRLRWRVLQRDNFKCCGCGSSPAITLGVELHVDHVHPWSEGGETVLENLQTLCSKCNLGKSNLLPA
jgi:hypothetical protein